MKKRNDNDSDCSACFFVVVVYVEIHEFHRRFACDTHVLHTDKSPDNVCLKLEFIRMNPKKRMLLLFKKELIFIVITHIGTGLAINHNVLNNNTK